MLDAEFGLFSWVLENDDVGRIQRDGSAFLPCIK